MQTDVTNVDISTECAQAIDGATKRLAERRHQMMLEAFADIEAGRLIDQAEIDEWVASLE